MNNDQFIKTLAKKTDNKQQATKEMVELLCEELRENFRKGGSATITHFGQFSIRVMSPREITNPLTSERMLIPTRRKLVFKPAPMLKEKIK